MFQTIRNHPQGQGLNLRLGFLRGLSVCENPWEINDLRNPAPVFLLFNLDREDHGSLAFLAIILRFRLPLAKPSHVG